MNRNTGKGRYLPGLKPIAREIFMCLSLAWRPAFRPPSTLLTWWMALNIRYWRIPASAHTPRFISIVINSSLHTQEYLLSANTPFYE
jgi:hypothetical protein